LIDSLYNLLFACRHRRTTFPLTPARKRVSGGQEEGPAETYVVCLDCGKQFAYDWENMRLGKAVDISEAEPIPGAETGQMPFRTKSGLKYLLWGSAVSAAVVLGKVAKARHQSRKSGATGHDDGQNGDHEKTKDSRTS